jgi:DNA-binding transcriptional MerR regulator
MQIGELARTSGIHLETIRYYEREGVLPRPARLANGRRTYDSIDARRLGFIRRARELGFDLSQVRTLLALQERPEASCIAATDLAQSQLEIVESRIARLITLREELRRMILECSDGTVAECRVVEALAGPAP